MIAWEDMSFAQRKGHGKGHLFRVGAGFLFEAPYRWSPELPDVGVLLLDDVVLVLENPIEFGQMRYFWKVLSKVGTVWTETKFFSEI